MKRIKGILRNVDVFENSEEHKMNNELREGIAPHILYECPHCDKMQVYFHKELNRLKQIPSLNYPSSNFLFS